eukprot:5042453-Pleurochrysis_carterae.AAC.1
MVSQTPSVARTRSRSRASSSTTAMSGTAIRYGCTYAPNRAAAGGHIRVWSHDGRGVGRAE